jgi:hypothetical protein
MQYIAISTVVVGKMRVPEQRHTVAFFTQHYRTKYVSYVEWNSFLKKRANVHFLPRLELKRKKKKRTSGQRSN